MKGLLCTSENCSRGVSIKAYPKVIRIKKEYVGQAGKNTKSLVVEWSWTDIRLFQSCKSISEDSGTILYFQEKKNGPEILYLTKMSFIHSLKYYRNTVLNMQEPRKYCLYNAILRKWLENEHLPNKPWLGKLWWKDWQWAINVFNCTLNSKKKRGHSRGKVWKQWRGLGSRIYVKGLNLE